MKRTTIKLPDEVDHAMRADAERRGITVSAWVREALRAHLPHQAGERRDLAFFACGDSGFTDTSQRTEEILAELLNSDYELQQAESLQRPASA